MGNPGGEGGAEYTALRREETRRALDLIGGATHHFLDHPDGRLGASWRPVHDLVRLMDQIQPAVVLFPSPYEVHPDHRAASLMTFRAARMLQNPPALYCYEVGAMMPANLLVDITPYMLRKERALSAFPSQMLHQDLVGKVRALNHARTVNVDDPTVQYAEAYLHVAAAEMDAFVRAVDHLLLLTDGMGHGCPTI
jgi:LmbE family N-acetylglucosaminyl deacetylase